MACPDENTFVEFIQGTLSVRVAREVEEHVDDCGSCRRLLAELARGSFAGVGSPSTEGLDDVTASMEGLRVGQVIAGRYRVLRPLGRGAMGRVYEVEDLQLQDRVALKLLRAEVTQVPQALQHLRHEVVLGRRVSHANVCRLHDIGTIGGQHYITMSLVQGENLAAILGRGLPPEPLTLSVLLQICDALEAAHAQGVVHRDLKSSNIMVDAQGKVTVMDFGLARDLWGEPSQSGMLVGSPAYWAPEQAVGERATERSDIYSLGVVGCELFGARRPLLGGEVDLDRVPRRFRPILRRCLARRPEDRFPSARALKQALRQATRPGRSRARVVIALCVVLAVGLGGAAAFVLWPRPVAKPPATVSQRPGRPVARPSSGARDSRVSSIPIAAVIVDSGASRRPVRRPRVVAVAQSPDARLVVPTPDAAPLAVPPASSGEALRRGLAEIEQTRARAELLVGDLTPYAALLAEARRALLAGELALARAAVERLRVLVRDARVDKEFIARKLARIGKAQAAQKLDEATARNVREIFAKVHASYFAGDYAAANRHLNQIWRLLRPGEG